MQSQTALRDEIARLFGKYKDLSPDLREAYEALPAEVYKDGLLTAKHKRLMALTAALVAGCRACILYQTDLAIRLGATPGEVLEACAVALSLGGTMAGGQITRVVALLEESGLA